MKLAKRHPKDGTKRHDYVESKIAHLKRLGLLVPTKTFFGYGMNNGACPNWLYDIQQGK